LTRPQVEDFEVATGVTALFCAQGGRCPPYSASRSAASDRPSAIAARSAASIWRAFSPRACAGLSKIAIQPPCPGRARRALLTVIPKGPTREHLGPACHRLADGTPYPEPLDRLAHRGRDDVRCERSPQSSSPERPLGPGPGRRRGCCPILADNKCATARPVPVLPVPLISTRGRLGLPR
jgi:hypothetical protein